MEMVGPGQGWTKQCPVTITNNTGGVLTNHQVKIEITYDSNMDEDFNDLRFYNSGNVELDYWIETYVASTSAVVWVKVPSVPTGGSDITMYYGNSGADTTSNGVNTFLFFDDMFDSYLSKWTCLENAETSIEQAHSGSRSVKMWDGFQNSRINGDYSHVGNFVLTFHQYFVTSANRSSTLFIKDASSEKYGLYVKYQAGHFYHAQSGAWTDLGAFAAGAWHKVEAAHDVTTNKVKIWIDDGYIGEYDFYSASINGYTQFSFQSENSNEQVQYVDDVYTREYASPEPTSEVGSETTYGNSELSPPALALAGTMFF